MTFIANDFSTFTDSRKRNGPIYRRSQTMVENFFILVQVYMINYILSVIILIVRHRELWKLQSYDETNNKVCSAMCACNKFIYLCGGYSADYSMSNQVLKYYPQADSTETLTPMISSRYGAAAIFYHGHLHVLGGCIDADDTELNLVEKYDFTTKTWTALPSMIMARAWHALAVLDGKLYVCGGKSPSTNSVEVYDPAKNSWQLIASMNKTRKQFLVVAREGKLWAIGGDNESTIEVYNPSKDQWQIDQEASSGLRMQWPAGGLISAS